MGKKATVIIGERYNKLVITRDAGSDHKSLTLVECRCDCGNILVTKLSLLKYGHTKSCGCLRVESAKMLNTKHGMSSSTEYKIYHSMLDRCYNENNKNYANYGARGIIVCERWLESFSNFYEDMGTKPKNLSLERKDVNGCYEPDNCMWETASEQAFNQRKSKANVSGKTGVYLMKDKGVWAAYIGKENKYHHLGVFATFEEAVEARQKAELELYGYLKDGETHENCMGY